MIDYQGDNTTGFQSPAGDYIEQVVDLAQILDLRRPGIYAVRIQGQDFRARGIHHRDILIVDATAPPRTGKVCVCFLNGETILAVLSRDDEQGEWMLSSSKGGSVAVNDEDQVFGLIKSLVRTEV